MKRDVDHGAMAVVGYTTPWSARALETVELHLSCGRPVTHVALRRVDVPVPEQMDWTIEATGQAPRQQAFEQGSYVRIAASEIAQAGDVTGLEFEIFLTRNEGPRTVVACDSLHLAIDEGVVSLTRNGRPLVDSEPVPSQVWLRVALKQDGQGLSTFWRLSSSIVMSIPAGFRPGAIFLADIREETLKVMALNGNR